jgi:glycosyltransferase involved in cell wall biosynthesis
MRIDICLPAYNEASIITNNTLKLYNFCVANLEDVTWQIILIINGSNDQSPELAKQLAQQYKQIKAVILPQGGKGRALKTYWLKSQADIICFMDSDLVIALEALPRLLSPLINHQADMVIGDRFHKQSIVKRPLIREMYSRLYSFLARLILHNKIRDLQCGFKALTKEAFFKLADKLTDTSWFFDTELIIWAEKLGLIIKNIAVDWREGRTGKRQSKLSLISNGLGFLKKLIKLRHKLKITL